MSLLITHLPSSTTRLMSLPSLATRHLRYHQQRSFRLSTRPLWISLKELWAEEERLRKTPLNRLSLEEREQRQRLTRAKKNYDGAISDGHNERKIWFLAAVALNFKIWRNRVLWMGGGVLVLAGVKWMLGKKEDEGF